MGGFGCLTSYNKLNALSPDLLDALEDGHTLVRGFQINGMVVCFVRSLRVHIMENTNLG